MKRLLFFIALVLLGSDLHAQELQAKININHQQVQTKDEWTGFR